MTVKPAVYVVYTDKRAYFDFKVYMFRLGSGSYKSFECIGYGIGF